MTASLPHLPTHMRYFGAVNADCSQDGIAVLTLMPQAERGANTVACITILARRMQAEGRAVINRTGMK